MTPGAAQFEEATFSEADPARPRTTNGSGVAYDERARIFACGDVRSGSVKRVASAVGEGSLAIALVHQYLREIERDAGERRGRNVVCVGAVASAGKRISFSVLPTVLPN
jgi:hypothetical protein